MMPTEPASVEAIASFIGAECRGNTHEVQIYASSSLPFNIAPLKRLSRGILVELALPARDINVVPTRFSQNGSAIARCGSGALAAAHALSKASAGGKLPMLSTSYELLRLQHRTDRFGYLSRSLHMRPQPASAQTPGLFNVSPASYMLAGGESDYLIAHFAQGSQLRELVPDEEAICQRTRRAVIATARSDDPLYDYVLRYFAPQYGQSEDAATGSANCVVAQYWQHILGKTRVSALQLSSEGGEIWVEAKDEITVREDCLPRLQWVSGRTTLIF